MAEWNIFGKSQTIGWIQKQWQWGMERAEKYRIMRNGRIFVFYHYSVITPLVSKVDVDVELVPLSLSLSRSLFCHSLIYPLMNIPISNNIYFKLVCVCVYIHV